MESFPTEFAHRIGVEADTVDDVLQMLSEYVWGQVRDDGRCHVPGLGSFYMVDGKKLFEPDTELARIVNHQYAGLNVLAVEDTGSHIMVDDLDNLDLPETDEFEPRWEEKTFSGSAEESVAKVDEPIELEETTFDGHTDDDIAVGDVVTGSNSFLDIDADAGSDVDVDVDTFGEPTVGPDDKEADLPVERDAIRNAASVDVDTADEDVEGAVDESAEDKALAEGLVVPIDENAEPVVAKGKPRASIWFYVLPLLAIVFLVMAVYWAQTRQRTPRPVVAEPIPAETENPPAADAGADPTTTEGEVEPEVSAWQPGGIDVASGGWTIVVSSKPTRAEAVAIAQQVSEDLQDESHPVDILESNVNGQTRYRVAVGQFRNSTISQREIRRLGGLLPDGSWALRITSN